MSFGMWILKPKTLFWINIFSVICNFIVVVRGLSSGAWCYLYFVNVAFIFISSGCAIYMYNEWKSETN